MEVIPTERIRNVALVGHGGYTTLAGPNYNLAAYPDATVSYWRWYSNGAGSTPFQYDTPGARIANNAIPAPATIGPTVIW